MPDQDTDNEMDELIRRGTQVEIPAEVEDRLRRRLTEFRTRVEQRPPNRWRSLAYPWTYRPAVRVMAMAAAALGGSGGGTGAHSKGVQCEPGVRGSGGATQEFSVARVHHRLQRGALCGESISATRLPDTGG